MTPLEQATSAIVGELRRQEPTDGQFFYIDASNTSATVIDATVDLVAVARAVLSAIREPNKAMEIAGMNALPAFEAPLQADASDCWQAMVDAALSE